MELELQGKSVVVTGGTRGIGLACAEAFAREGSSVTIVGREQQTVDEAASRVKTPHGEVAKGLVADLSGSAGLDCLRECLADADVLINNAGAIPVGDLEHIDDCQWRAAWELKVFGYINATRMALPIMKSRRAGVVVNVVGIAGVAPRNDYLCGSTANAALNAFTQAVGSQSTIDGVRVLGVNPGATETDRLIGLFQSRAEQRFGDASRWREMLLDLPFGRPAKPEEVADLVVFLASARASYLSGVVIDADGGRRFAKQT